jgi:pyruvate dehydrogenase E2 component (dihydrolipoamide acetyltransferase)
MATKVFMEALSPTMEEGRLVKWLRQEGDVVKSGDTLAEVETDKAIMELVARGDGVLRQRLLADGGTTAVGTLIAVIAAAGENIDALLAGADVAGGGGGGTPPASAPAKAAPPTTPTAGVSIGGPPPIGESTSPIAAQRDQSIAAGILALPSYAAAAQPAPDGGRARTSPLARRLAAERGVDLRALHGSGPAGRIVKRDIEAAASDTRSATQGAAAGMSAASGPVATSPTPRAIPMVAGADITDVPLTQIRKTIARRLAESIGPIPTFYLTAELDLERVAEMRTAMAEMGDAFKVSFNDIILKAVATALALHPECNAHWLGDGIRYFSRVHLGMAVAVPEGLITPVIFDAQSKGLGEIARESRDLAARARERKLKPDEYTGSTFSVSNLGMFGIDQFTAIINPPEAGILAIGALESKAVVVDGAVTVRKRMRVTMSCDHRVIDGALGAKFLQTLRRLIENPLMLVY